MSATVADGVGAKGDALTAMVKKFSEENDMSIVKTIKTVTSRETAGSGSSSRTGGGSSGGGRTLCEPTFVSPHVPINVNSIATPHRKMSIAEFGHVEFFVCTDVPVVCGVLMNIASVLLMQ